jgi:nitrogen regulatory protein P-II 1
MKLLVIVLNATEMLEEVLEGLIETGISGGTVVDSEGMGHIIEEVPLFAGMRNLFRSAKPRNKVIVSVISDAEAREGLEVLEKILGCSHEKGKGIAFVLPIESVIGLGKTD